MLKISVNKNFFLEKKYILEVLLEEFLCFYDYEIEVSKDNDYVFLNTQNNKKITFIDSFFTNIKDDYLKLKYLPKEPMFFTYLSKEYTFPYGEPKITLETNNLKCYFDIFASSYFFLSRWEEYVIKEKDHHQRFIDDNSWIVQNNLHYRPLVNEYASLLCVLLNKIGISPKQIGEFTPIITHDVDLIARYDSLKKVIKAIVGDLILRKSIKSFFKTVKDVIYILANKMNDNYDTFDYLMDLSESIDVKSHFYFIPGKKNEYDVRYSYNEKKAIEIYEKIRKRGHIIGLHPSYNSFLDREQVLKEKKRLESKVATKIVEGRQHYLRINLPNSWQIWDDVGLKEDSSIGFNKCFGFRTGSCYKYSVFDFINREKLELKENPLLAMEVASEHFNKRPIKMLEDLKIILNEVKKYNGNFTLLWHNSSFMKREHNETYEKIIELLKYQYTK
ncbi:polysaccharide deacetylase [Polaribacter pacificus]|uniref:Polysaccharide deacetylase n=1 Tax=Polaribacter pacificus TaxID=1775173 RepID=A0A917MF79_9FLAO|nr:polysaccharide deacetylase family protein [Polaribacter pacificus]GGH01656.1 polysaccharide deacetylase [Polaribacter pacificus]